MIEIPFSFFGITDWILGLGDPIMIIMLATFGTLFSMAIILPLISITPLKKYMPQITGGLFSSVFVSLMVLISFNLILGVNSALKLLLIWWVILLSCITYWFINYRYIKDVTGNKFAKFQEKALEAEEKRRQNRKSKK
ncbi:hypothetical protein NOM07_08705 [Proteus terrae]|uniref:hypothetical protein n=1 Tax=Proteus terrae TaxID=1574161 RepID=UPI00217EDE7D|nr:hypothetical protein [Proteus terrae]MCS6713463.1 hypothetical protein [Proteus terrae]MCS6732442.1 hypothetical protein [Proteus terrae]